MPPTKRNRNTDTWEPIKKSIISGRTSNPIRKIVDQLKPPTIEGKPFIPLSIGDPTLDGNLRPPQGTLDHMVEQMKTHKFDGYGPANGLPPARAAIAKYHKDNFAKNASFGADDVVITSGASHALEMAIGSICDEGDNILIPEPCFSLYITIADSRGIIPKYYKCKAENNFAIDLEDLKSKVNDRTKAILINNPSNPCGSNFARSHVEDLIKVAEELKLPLICDEIYAGLVFGDEVFTSCADIKCNVPRFIIGGLAKNFMVPGWRVGWVIKEDPLGVLSQAWEGLAALSTLIVGANMVVQSTIPKLLLETPVEYYDDVKKVLSTNGNMCYEKLKVVKGLTPSVPQAAMYMMVEIDFSVYSEYKDDVEFAKGLLAEEAVMVLPGTVFRANGFVRIVTAKGEEKLNEAMNRVVAFCEKHQAKK